MKAVLAVLCTVLLQGSASAATDLEPHNNLAYASPHVGIPQLAVPFPHHRKLYKEDEPRCDKTLSFKYGVASGDPFPDSVVIWTRAVPAADSPSATQGTFQVRYRVCTDAAMKNEVAKGKVLTSADVDYTIKVIVGGLKPSTKYYYDFSACDKKISSAVGKTKTLPAADADVQSVNLATVSCSKFDVGYFHAYGGIADKADTLDAVLRLGDFIYEYNTDAGAPAGRNVYPPKEIVTLQDYRLRYQTYHTDPALVRVRAALPLIVVPDDHEVTNDGWEGGAQNHQPTTEGDWQTRVAVAFRALFEWQPIRQVESDNQRLYRSFNFGQLVHLSMIDTRYNEREQQESTQYPEWLAAAKKRKIMSDTQMSWLVNNMQTAPQKWKVIGNQLLITDFVDVERQKKYSASADQWVSYKASQKALLDGVENVRNVIVYTGDIHNSYVFEGFSNPSNGGLPYYVEFVGTSVTSGNRADGLRANGANDGDIETARQVLLQNPSMIDADIDCHGYFITRYSKGYMLADYYCATNIKSATDTSERSTWHYKVCDGKSKAIKASEPCSA